MSTATIGMPAFIASFTAGAIPAESTGARAIAFTFWFTKFSNTSNWLERSPWNDGPTVTSFTPISDALSFAP